MTKISDINLWAADKCGITVGMTGWDESNGFNTWHEWRWTIEDPRCREIVRENFKINTSYIDRDLWRSVEMKWRKKEPDSTGSYCLSATGKVIAEAEIACITAIYEAEQE